MSDIMERTVWYKMRYTPVRDFLRGRITARLDLRRPLEKAALPPATQQVILDVVSNTRLWRLEKLEVTQDLIAHFADGIDSGGSHEQLLTAFGDPKQAAKLIRRAKRRNRALPWQISRVAGWATAAFLVFYGVFAIYFFSGSPSPRIDYLAKLNQVVEQTPVEGRAWPLYRRALLGLDPVWRKPVPDARLVSQSHRPESQAFLDAVTKHAAEIEMIREGASKPTLGFIFGLNGSGYDAELWPEQKRPNIDPAIGQALAAVNLPPINTLHNMGVILRADATLARSARDGKRLLRDVNSLLGLSRQVSQSGPLLCGMVSLTMYDAALDEIELTLREDPELVSREDWIALAHRLSTAKVAGDLITFDMERMSFEDMLQRSFTDDGSGNGRLTPQGVEYLTVRPGGQVWMKKAVLPAAGLLAASRQDLARRYSSLVNHAATNLRVPMREADWRSVRNYYDEQTSLMGSVNRMIAVYFVPAYWKAQEIAERSLGRRDGVLVAITLEVFRREHGKYPDALDALVPYLLPEVPPDRLTGAPTRYRLMESGPLLYSVGADRKDDGGRPGADIQKVANWDAAETTQSGDWILYPTLKIALR
jgi:hypothetical protein